MPEATSAPLSFADLAPLHRTWVEHNFPGGDPAHCLLGVNEELGELAEAYAGAGPAARLDALDALGDVSIYLVDFVRRISPLLDKAPEAQIVGAIAANAHEQSLTEARRGGPRGESDLTRAVGRLNHAFLKWKQGIRGSKAEREEKIGVAVLSVLRALHNQAAYFGTTLEQVIGDTWAVVGSRDWVAYPKTGRPPKE